MTQHMAYDYDAQRWVTGPDAVPLLIEQLAEALELLRRPECSQDLVRGYGCTVEHAAAQAEAQLAELLVEFYHDRPDEAIDENWS